MLDVDARTKLEEELRDCYVALTSVKSDIGDWKIAKIQEYTLTNKDTSEYNITDISNRRDTVRNRINEIINQLEADNTANNEAAANEKTTAES